MAVTVKYLIGQSYMAGVRVACGESSLMNRVEGLTFFYDAYENGVSKNNLVLAVAGELRKYSGDQAEQIAEMFLNQRVSALIIKMEEKYTDQDEALISVFAKHRFPVLLFPSDMFFASLIRGINYDIIYSQGYNLSNSYEDNCLQEMVCVERDEHSILKYAKMMGIRVNEYLCIVMLKPSVGMEPQKLAHSCHEYIGNQGLISLRNGTVMLMLRSTKDYAAAGSDFRRLARELYSHLKTVYKKEGIIMGVGHAFENQIEIRKSYHSAKTALMDAMSSPDKGVLFYDDMGIYRILYHLRNRKDLYELRNATVGRVQEYDLKNRTEYAATIKAYIDNFYSIRNTSRELYVQYNTIRYRISKIKEEFGWDLFDRDDCIYLTIGFQADDFLQEEKEY